MYDKLPLWPSLVKTVAGVLQTEQILCPMIQWPGGDDVWRAPRVARMTNIYNIYSQGNFLLSSHSHNSQPQLGGCPP